MLLPTDLHARFDAKTPTVWIQVENSDAIFFFLSLILNLLQAVQADGYLYETDEHGHPRRVTSGGEEIRVFDPTHPPRLQPHFHLLEPLVPIAALRFDAAANKFAAQAEVDEVCVCVCVH